MKQKCHFRGVASVNVTFDIDVDGILSVTAEDRSTQNSQCITIMSYTGSLSQQEVNRMVTEAKVMAARDQKEKTRIETRNHFEGYINDVKNASSNIIDLDDKSKVLSALKEATEWLDINERAYKEDYDREMQKLTDVWNPIIRNVYGAAE